MKNKDKMCHLFDLILNIQEKCLINILTENKVTSVSIIHKNKAYRMCSANSDFLCQEIERYIQNM